MRSSILLVFFGAFSLVSANAQVSHNITLLGQYHDPSLPSSGGNRYNDIWGYTDCELREYAIMGSAARVHFFNLETPTSPQHVVSFAGGSTTSWRDMKTFRNRAYSVCDNCSEGLMIFDLSQLPNTVTKTKQTTQFFSSAHNIYIDEEAGWLYVAGSNTKSNGVIILDLNADPDNPTQIGNPTLPAGYIHDIYVRDNIGYCSHGNNGLWVYNFSNPQSPVLLGSLTDYPQSGYNHSSWLSEDGQHAVMADETFNKGIKMLDVSDLTDITVTDVFRSALLGPADTASIAHNPFIRDNYVFISYYHDGVQVFDMSNPNNVQKVAWYDTYPTNTNYNGFFGCWGVYAFLSSGIIVASDMTNGLFVLSLNNITLDPIPYPTYPASSITLTGANPFCQGQSVTLSVDPTATDVDWYRNGIPIQGGGNTILAQEAGWYKATVYRGHCAVQTDSIEVQVIPLPIPVITPLGNPVICQGGSVFLSVDPSATAVHWYRNGVLYQVGGFLLQVQQAGVYSAILFNQFCQIQTNTVQVQVIPYPSPVMTLTGNPLICEGESVTFTVDPTATDVDWYLNGILQAWQGTEIVATAPGVYSAIVFNQSCSVQTNSINIAVIPFPSPDITLSGDPAICEGSSVFLSATPPFTSVSWLLNGQPLGLGGPQIEVQSAGTYSAILLNQFCQIQSDSVDIEVIPYPNTEIVLSGDASICEGESVTLSAVPPFTTASWYFNGQPLGLQGPQIQAQAAGTYYALISNQSCSIQSELVEIEVIPFPLPVITPLGNPVICEGGSVTLSADPSATEIEWYLNGVLHQIGGPVLQAQQAGAYSAVLYNQFCQIQSNTVQVQVIPYPSPTITLAGNPLICEGESATLSVDPAATAVEWYLNGVLQGWQGTQIAATEPGAYSAVVYNQFCSIQTNSIGIFVIPLPNPEIALSGDPSICEGDSVTLSVSPPFTDVEWYLDGELLNWEGSQIAAQTGGAYSVILYNQFCQMQSDPVVIQVIPSPSPEVALAGEATLCEGESATLSADASATGIAWYLDGELLGWEQAELEVQAAGTYYAILSNQFCEIQTESVEIQVIPYPGSEIAPTGETSICEGESVTINVDTSAKSVVWYLDGVLLAEGGPQIEAQAGGWYYAILSNQSCAIQTDSVEIQVIPAPSPEIALSGEASFCEGDSATLSVDASAASIAWYFDGELLGWEEAELQVQLAGTYYAILSNSLCDIQTESVEIQVIAFPDPTIVVSGEATFCEGESATLSADASAGSIAWYLDGELLGWEEAELEVQSAGTYYAILSNQACAVQSEAVEIEVIPAPNPEIALSGEASLCEGESATLSVDVSATSIAWYLDGELLGWEEAELEVQTAGAYYAILSNEYCTVQTDSVVISIVEAIVPALSFLNDTLFATSAAAYQWFLNGELLEGATGPFIVPQESGVYTVWTTDENGCEALSDPFEVEIINSVSTLLPQGWKVYPNPAADRLTLELPGADGGIFALYDLTGVLLMRGELAGEKTEIRLEGFSAGVYVLEIEVGGFRDRVKVVVLGGL